MTPVAVVRAVVLVAVVVTPTVVIAGPVYGFDIPKLVILAVTCAALLVLTLPATPTLWRATGLPGRIALAAAGTYALWLLVATVASDTPRLSVLGPDGRFVGTLTLLAPVILLVAVPVAATTRRHLDVALRLLTGVLTLIAVYAVVQALGLDPMPWGPPFGGRPVATFGNSNFVGAVLCVLVPLALWLYRRLHTSTALAMAVGLIGVLALWRSEARLGWVAAATGAIAFALTYHTSRWEKAQGWLLAAIPAGVVAAGLAVVGVGMVIGDTTSLARRGYWSAALPMWADNALVGVGPGRFGAFHRAYRPPSAVIESGTDIVVDSSHAFVIDLGATTGVPGMVLWLTVLVAIGLLLRTAWHATSGQDRLLVTVAVSLLAAHGMQSSISVPTVTTVWLGWLLLGFALAVSLVVASPAGKATTRRRPRTSTSRTRDRRSARQRSRDNVVLVVAATATIAAAVPALAVWNSSVDMGRGFAYRSNGLHEQAFAHYDDATTRTPWWPEAWRDRGVSADALGDQEELRASLEGTLDADPRNRQALALLVELDAAEIGTAAAGVWYGRLRELDPNGLVLHLDVAQWALRVDDTDLAGEALDVVARSIGPDLRYWDRYQQLRAQL